MLSHWLLTSGYYRQHTAHCPLIYEFYMQHWALCLVTSDFYRQHWAVCLVTSDLYRQHWALCLVTSGFYRQHWALPSNQWILYRQPEYCHFTVLIFVNQSMRLPSFHSQRELLVSQYDRQSKFANFKTPQLNHSLFTPSRPWNQQIISPKLSQTVETSVCPFSYIVYGGQKPD